MYLFFLYISNAALGSTFAFSFIGFWMQLSERLGPVIINLSRVIADVATIICNYILILVAFSFGILFVSTIDISGSNASKMTHDTSTKEEDGVATFKKIITTLFWALLNPGPDTENFPEEGFTGILTNTLYIIYQIFTVIMLLNLLIAMMNSTIQKIQEKRLLYWKFERTSILIEFTNDYQMVPPPFATIQLALYLPVVVLQGMWLLYRKMSKKKESNLSLITDEENHVQGSPSRKYNCKMDPLENSRRKRHARLMKKLIESVLQKETYFEDIGSLIEEKRTQNVKDMQ